MTAPVPLGDLGDALDPGGWRPRPRKRWTRSPLRRAGVNSRDMRRYLSLCAVLGLPCGRRERRSYDLMDRAERVDVDPSDLPATLSTPADPFGVAELDAETRVDLARFVDALGALDALTDRHRHILIRRAMGDTLYEVAQDVRLSTERVRQLELDAYARVRHALKVESSPARNVSADAYEFMRAGRTAAWCAKYAAGG